MSNKTIPFWTEGMKASDRSRSVVNLFDILESKMSIIIDKMGIYSGQTFAFVPDPPPLVFSKSIQNLDVNSISWGNKGRAIATNNKQVAKNLAPIMFDLWSDSLYIMLFNKETTDDVLLKQWITTAIQNELGTAVNNTTEPNRLPKYVFLHFDWGDLVE